MVRGPDATDTGVDTAHGLCEFLVLLARCVAQQLGLLQDLVGVQVAHTDGTLPAGDIVADNEGVARRPRRNGELDLGVFGGELLELLLDEQAGEG